MKKPSQKQPVRTTQPPRAKLSAAKGGKAADGPMPQTKEHVLL